MTLPRLLASQALKLGGNDSRAGQHVLDSGSHRGIQNERPDGVETITVSIAVNWMQRQMVCCALVVVLTNSPQ